MGFGTALFAVSAAQAVGQIASGYSQNAEAKANASMVEDAGRYNASVLEGKASIIDIQSDIEQGRFQRLKGQYMSKSVANVAKQGVGLQGSAMAVILNAQTQINIDQAIAKFNSTNDKNYTIAAANEATRQASAQADALRRQGSAAVRSGYTGALSSLLQGGVNYLAYKMPTSTTFDYSTKQSATMTQKVSAFGGGTSRYSLPNMRVL